MIKKHSTARTSQPTLPEQESVDSYLWGEIAMPTTRGVRERLARSATRLTAVFALSLICTTGATLASVTHGNASIAPTCGGEYPTTAAGSSWTCTFDDEFTASTLDTSKWVPQLSSNSGYATGPVGSMACYVNSPNNVAVSGGYLDLTARKEATPFTCSDPYGNFTTQYTAGEVSSYGKFSQAYGRFEVRAKLPSTTVKGLQETLWLWPDNYTYGAWPASGEIDFSEFYSQYATYDIPYLHYNYDPSVTTTTQTTTTTSRPAGPGVRFGSPGTTTTTKTVPANQVEGVCPINYGQFNTYVATWSPGTITISVNGTSCLTDNYVASGLASPAPFNQPFMLALTQALGIGTNAFDPATTPLPATTQVDYVRVWK